MPVNKNAFEIEKGDGYATLHFQPHSTQSTAALRFLYGVMLLGPLLGWIPAAILFMDLGRLETEVIPFGLVWMGPPIAAAIALKYLVSRQKMVGSDYTTIKLFSDGLRTAGEVPRAYMLEEIGTFYSQSMDGTFVYKSSGDYARKKAQVESAGKVSFSVVMDAGIDKVIVIESCLKEIQAEAIRDFLSAWKNDPDGVIANVT